MLHVACAFSFSVKPAIRRELARTFAVLAGVLPHTQLEPLQRVCATRLPRQRLTPAFVFTKDGIDKQGASSQTWQPPSLLRSQSYLHRSNTGWTRSATLAAFSLAQALIVGCSYVKSRLRLHFDEKCESGS